MVGSSSSSTKLSVWLRSLLSAKFFNLCTIHTESKKNEKNIFCLNCCETICHQCTNLHNSHRLLQIRRYLYCDVIRLGDAQKLINCSHVQAYTTNSAKVVFLNPRPQTRPCRTSSNNCITCDKSLQDPYIFCSISCKVLSKEMTSEDLHHREVLRLPELGSDVELVTPDSIFEPKTSSGSTVSGSDGGVNRLTLPFTATSKIVRKKRTPRFEIPVAARTSITPPVIRNPVNRRKSLPYRSPFS